MRKRVGRPEIDPSQKRESVFRFVTTKAEAARIRDKAKALGLTISHYLRSVAIPKK
jgi:hypothetical protein